LNPGSDVQNSKLAAGKYPVKQDSTPPILNSVRLSPAERWFYSEYGHGNRSDMPQPVFWLCFSLSVLCWSSSLWADIKELAAYI
jgi:hypothetical protein